MFKRAIQCSHPGDLIVLQANSREELDRMCVHSMNEILALRKALEKTTTLTTNVPPRSQKDRPLPLPSLHEEGEVERGNQGPLTLPIMNFGDEKDREKDRDKPLALPSLD